MAIGVGLPILLVLSLLSFLHYVREKHLLEEQFQLTSSQLGQLTLGGLKHAFTENDQEHIRQITSDVGSMPNVQRVQIVDRVGRVWVDSTNQEVGATHQTESLGCVQCHAIPIADRPQAAWLDSQGNTLRISAPIPNESVCRECHSEQQVHLGMVILDLSAVDAQAHLIRDLKLDMAIASGSSILITSTLYLLVHFLVVRRVEAFRLPLAQFAKGELSTRLPAKQSGADELGQLALTFNQMADEIQERDRERIASDELRSRTIREERERIARELHDGLAQLLGYVNTKAMAVRLLLKQRQPQAAQEHLSQLEEAARGLFVDVREAILGLRMHASNGLGIAGGIEEYSKKFSRMTDLPIEVAIDPAIENYAFDADVELHLQRIVQEALSNIRKHASAKQAWITLETSGHELTLRVRDDGVGFNPAVNADSDHGMYGLGSMQERADAIGAHFVLDSKEGVGTSIEVRFENLPHII